MSEEIGEIMQALDIEQWCEDEGISFKKSRGHSGMQLNLKECPECGDRRYRTYLNAETGVGNCFICNQTYNKYTFIRSHLGASNGEVMKRIKADLAQQGW